MTFLEHFRHVALYRNRAQSEIVQPMSIWMSEHSREWLITMEARRGQILGNTENQILGFQHRCNEQILSGRIRSQDHRSLQVGKDLGGRLIVVAENNTSRWSGSLVDYQQSRRQWRFVSGDEDINITVTNLRREQELRNWINKLMDELQITHNREKENKLLQWLEKEMKARGLSGDDILDNVNKSDLMANFFKCHVQMLQLTANQHQPQHAMHSNQNEQQYPSQQAMPSHQMEHHRLHSQRHRVSRMAQSAPPPPLHQQYAAQHLSQSQQQETTDQSSTHHQNDHHHDHQGDHHHHHHHQQHDQQHAVDQPQAQHHEMQQTDYQQQQQQSQYQSQSHSHSQSQSQSQQASVAQVQPATEDQKEMKMSAADDSVEPSTQSIYETQRLNEFMDGICQKYNCCGGTTYDVDQLMQLITSKLSKMNLSITKMMNEYK